MTRHLPLFPLLSLFALTACPGPDLIEKTGPAFELSDADPSKVFEAKITFEPENARYGSVKAFDLSAELTRTNGADPIGVDLLVSPKPLSFKGEYVSTKLDAAPRWL